MCVLCGANLESVPHLFLHCSVADHLRNTLFDIFGECWVCPATLDQLLLYWFWQEEEAKYLWQCATYATVWGIWLERNFRTFNDRFSHKQILWDKIRRLASIWCKAHNLFRGISLSNMLRD